MLTDHNTLSFFEGRGLSLNRGLLAKGPFAKGLFAEGLFAKGLLAKGLFESGPFWCMALSREFTLVPRFI